MRFETYIKISRLMCIDSTITLEDMKSIQTFLNTKMSRDDRMMKT